MAEEGERGDSGDARYMGESAAAASLSYAAPIVAAERRRLGESDERGEWSVRAAFGERCGADAASGLTGGSE